MQVNDKKLSGILKKKQAQKNYNLRRYFPDVALAPLIEQFWFVDWELFERSHTQKNLPDPNFHLVLEEGNAKIVGPVTKAYSYEMTGQSSIVGIKFTIGALTHILSKPVAYYVDKEWAVEDVFGHDFASEFRINATGTDNAVVEQLQQIFSRLVVTEYNGQNDALSDRQKTEVASCLQLIQTDHSINTVEQLSVIRNSSVRTLQRLFKEHVGVSPKLLIRKYRLHQALEDLDTGKVNMLDLVTRLDYVDQSHLIKDFKDLIGITPTKYLKL